MNIEALKNEFAEFITSDDALKYVTAGRYVLIREVLLRVQQVLSEHEIPYSNFRIRIHQKFGLLRPAYVFRHASSDDLEEELNDIVWSMFEASSTCCELCGGLATSFTNKEYMSRILCVTCVEKLNKNASDRRKFKEENPT